ncbi:MAG: acetate kinase, partial [Thermodesulfobacteriota bacterium]
MKILVLNAGSSSLKFELFDMDGLSVLASGMVEQIGEPSAHARIDYRTPGGQEGRLDKSREVADHRAAIEMLVTLLRENGILREESELAGIG